MNAHVPMSYRRSIRRWGFRLLPAFVLGTGVLLIVSAILYGTVAVGVPYQDASPEMQARQDFHLMVTDMLVLVGGIACVAGLLLAVAWAIAWAVKSKSFTNAQHLGG